ncbi:MAG TPA: M28 family metallopeptidase [Solirubrobacteraceae bacterium]|nr:M28 family metallopeptidase [Solirubrobacteraceae bacterium]
MSSRRRALLTAAVAAALIAGCGGGDEPAGATPAATPAPAATASASAGEAPAATGAELRRDRFNSARAWAELERQVALGPRPAGSEALRGLAERLRDRLPRGAFERVPGHPGLRNVVGRIPGRKPAIAVAAHYDTKDLPGFVGANDGASGTAVVAELARALRKAPRPKDAREIRFLLFDGEEATDDARPFLETGVRGSKAYAKRHDGELKALILLDFVGAKGLRIQREALSDAGLWSKLRAAARRVGAQDAFPSGTASGIQDDHVPFIERGVPAIDLIQWPYDCWHEPCDDLSQVEERSLDLTGETVFELVRTLSKT